MISSKMLDTIKYELEQVLPEIGERLGVFIKVGSGTYGVCGSLKLEVASISGTGEIESKERIAFKQLANSYGLTDTDLDKTFVQNGKTYTIVGLRPKAYKMPILAKSKFPAETVCRLLGKTMTSQTWKSSRLPESP